MNIPITREMHGKSWRDCWGFKRQSWAKEIFPICARGPSVSRYIISWVTMMIRIMVRVILLAWNGLTMISWGGNCTYICKWFFQATIRIGTWSTCSTKRCIWQLCSHLKLCLCCFVKITSFWQKITSFLQDDGFGRLSDYAISFHYVPPKTMYVLLTSHRHQHF